MKRIHLTIAIMAALPSAQAFLTASSLHQNRRAPSRISPPAASASPAFGPSEQVGPLPKVVVFDLDGCLWRPEMYELIWFSGGKGAPFRIDEENPDVLLTRGDETVYLLGDVREVMRELHLDEMWRGARVGISSRTDEPSWARELLTKFRVDCGDSCGGTFTLHDVFELGPIEIAKDSKVEHFRRIVDSCGVSPEDILFFDNESGNCREVARMGVTVVYVPDGVTSGAWKVAKETFPQTDGKVIGVDVLAYDSLDGASRFF